ncbi:MAG: hypothetical protein ABR540_14675 [Acidimicrobiales bacterium]
MADTSRGGRYHNRRYRDLAVELGLDVEHHPTYGWSTTQLTQAAAADYREVLEDLGRALVLWRRTEGTRGSGPSSRNLIACRCPCGRKIRAAASTIAEAPIVCSLCKDAFAPG